MIDLSFLTEEEQDTILIVLKRDAKLKQAEEQRVQNLKNTLSDKSQLRYLTGEWFYETKQHRHQDRIHGSDIIRASMKHTSKPLNKCLSVAVTDSVFHDKNNEVFLPSGLAGVQCEPQRQPGHARFPGEKPLPHEKSSLQLPSKEGASQRKNPFNCELPTPHTLEENTSQFQGATDEMETSRDELPPSTDSNISETAHLQFIPDKLSVFMPIPENKGFTSPSQDYLFEVDELSDTHISSADPRGFLNHMSPSSSTNCDIEPRSPGITVGNTETWIDRKNVRFSPILFQKEMKQDGKELGEYRMLDFDLIDPSDIQNEINLENNIRGACIPLLKQNTIDSVEAELKCVVLQKHVSGQHKVIIDLTENGEQGDSPTLSPSTRSAEPEQDKSLDLVFEQAHHSQVADWPEQKALQPSTVNSDAENKPGTNSVSPKPRQTLIGNKEAGKAARQQDVAKICQINLPVNTFNLQIEAVQCIMEKVSAVKELAETLKMEEITVPQLTEEKLKDIMSSGDFGTHRDTLEEKPVEASWERKSTRKKIPIEQQLNEELTLTVLQNVQVYSAESSKESLSPQTEIMIEKTATESLENVSSSQSESGITIDLVIEEESLISPCKFQAPRSKEVRGSSTKTCHPRVLPRESSSPKRSRLQGSPLRTFLIDIKPETKADDDERPERPVPRQRKSHLCGTQKTLQKDPKLIVHNDVPPLQLVKSVTEGSYSLNEKKRKLEDSPCLARSAIPQDYQHYLGPHKKAHVPPFQSDEVAQEAKIITVGHQEDTGHNPIHSRLCIIQSRGETNQLTSTVSTSLSLESLACSGDNCYLMNPPDVRQSPRCMSSSKSLDDLYQKHREETSINNPREEMNQSVNDVPSFSLSTSSIKPHQITTNQVQTSVSTPVLQQIEADSDSLFETTFDSRRNTGSSTSNISFASEMSSVPYASGSTRSIYALDFSAVEVQGSIHYAVNYIQKLQEFQIFVVLCRDLAVADTKRHCADPYVKCYLLPDKTKLGKRKTNVKKRTLNPTFNEILKFKTKLEVLKTQSLYVSVWHNNTFGRNTFLGEVDQDMSGWDLSNTRINEYALKARVSGQTSTPSPLSLPDSRGLMTVSLRFLPQTSHSKKTSVMETGEVQIWVKDCKNLPSDRGPTMDPFVKCTVLPDPNGKSRQKTRVVKRTANPMFNHTMVYDGFRPEDLREACVEITVWDHDRWNHHYIGGIRLGLGTGKSYGIDVVWMDSTMEEANLWKRMLQSDGQWVEDILPLRMLVITKCRSK
ncbi:synaptotagmin-like protein 2 isoform X2 [Dunckerocampus dactyliophorus]|uniref:synaptotagmin-like protein 2 isoform X2 n=1 Tax=Dunckerocampus dactyliophorus TaxID=161453 RepID=UPI002405FA20|nr:synaptotagmin-like protein 2 isoform X2 [Dunckerocampus dactyliophorus]